VLGTRVYMESVIRLAAREFASLKAAIAAARAERRDPVVLEWGYDRSRPRTIEVAAVEWRLRPSAVTGTPVVEWTGEKVTRTLPYLPMDAPVASVARPKAYLIPPAWTDVIERLQIHGIAIERLEAPRTLDVEIYRVPDAKLRPAPNEGRATVDPGTIVSERVRHTFPAGTVRVSTDQPLGDLAVALLEPRGVDSFFQWGFFLGILQQTEYVETYIMAPTAERMLAEDPALKAEFEKKVAEDAEFAKNPRARVRWFYDRTPFPDDRYRRYPVARER
jgi:hypothetical protein